MFALDFKKSKLTLINCIELVAPVLLDCLRKILVVCSERRESTEKLKIWISPGIFDHCKSKKLFLRDQAVCLIFEEFLRHGWVARCFTNLYRNSKRSCVIFENKGHCYANPRVVALSTNSPKKINLQNGNAELANVINEAIDSEWSNGLNYVSQDSASSFKFKFHGNPWDINRACSELVESRNLVLKIIKRFYELGYHVFLSGHPGSAILSADTIFFLKSSENIPLKMGLSSSFLFGLLRSNRIYVINAPPGVLGVIVKCIDCIWKPGLEYESPFEDDPSSHIFKLKESPWCAEGGAGLKARFLILRLFEDLRVIGWQLHSTVNLTHRIDDVSSFVMVECEPSAVSYMCINFNRTKCIRFVNAREEIVNTIFKKMNQRMVHDCFDESDGEDPCYYYEGFPELCLKKEFPECIDVVLLLLKSIECMGCSLVSSADLSARYHESDDGHNPIDLPSWFFEVTLENSLPTSSDFGACGLTRKDT